MRGARKNRLGVDYDALAMPPIVRPFASLKRPLVNPVQQLLFAPLTLSVGIKAPITSSTFARAFDVISLGVIQGTTWPTGRVFRYSLTTLDAVGATLRVVPLIELVGGLWIAKDSSTVTESDLRFALLPNERAVRVVFNVLISARIGFRVQTA
jgi:hypothetical protein